MPVDEDRAYVILSSKVYSGVFTNDPQIKAEIRAILAACAEHAAPALEALHRIAAMGYPYKNGEVHASQYAAVKEARAAILLYQPSAKWQPVNAKLET